MKKKLAQITSCLLCLAMLVSMAGPAVAVTADDFYEEIVFDPNMDIADDPLNIDAPETGGSDPSAMDSLPSFDEEAQPLEADGEYEIYPTPHSITYGAASSTITLPSSLPVVYGAGIDDATKTRARVAFEQVGVTLNQTSSASGMALRVSIKSSGDGVTANTANLFSKDGAYKLTIDSNGVTIVGANTDAAFYGLTSMKHILYQVAKQSAGNKTVRTLVMEDYADVAFRGFIEGYYGNPWTVEDRAELMRFGGEFKMNIYFYAPKDDEKHNKKWRELYTQEELNTLIKPLADAGNESKCYYGFALHCFMNSPFSVSNYDADLATLKAKYEQAMSVGVRQIALLGDDAGMPAGSGTGSNNVYTRILNDLTDWLKSDEMQRKYPGLQTSLPFCPGGAGGMVYAHGNGNDALLKSLAPLGTKEGKLTGNVPIIMTGGAVWGHVSPTFATNFTNNVGVGPFYWVNWPCSDNSKSSLVFGGHDITLEKGITPGSLKGIMLNPMQQSEPSKWGIFQNADYAWNLWQSDDRSAQAGYDGFKYVDHVGADETPASTAFRELAKHMIRMNNNGNTNYNESIDLSPKLTSFKNKLSAGTLTVADVDDMRTEFQTLYDAAVLFRDGDTTGRNTRLLGTRNADGTYPLAQEQMAPWLDAWVDLTGGTLDLLDALKASLSGSTDADAIVSKYLSGQSKIAEGKNHGFTYIDHLEYATVGGQHVTPFITPLLKHVSKLAQNIINPSAPSVEETIIHSFSNMDGNENLAYMRDGDETTVAIFKNSSSASVNPGDYLGLTFAEPISLRDVRFEFGASNATGDIFGAGKLQYLPSQNGQWTDVPNGTFSSVASVSLDSLDLKNVWGFRVVNTASHSGWCRIKEIYYNETGGSGTIEQLSGTVYTNKVAYGGYPTSNLIDGDDDTYFWTNSNSAVDDYVGLNLGSVKNVGRVRFIVGGNKSSDRWTSYKLQYSADGSAWTDVKTYSGSGPQSIEEEDLGSVRAQYVRVVNLSAANAWAQFSEFTVWSAPEGGVYGLIAYQSENVKKIAAPQAVLENDFASLSSNSVVLRPGEFIGIQLPRARDVVELTADYSAPSAPGLVLKAGVNEAELSEVSDPAAYSGATRYIRLENTGNQAISFVLNELSVRSDEVTGIVFDSSDMDRRDGQDARTNNATGKWFDGNVGTSAKFCDQQIVGKYVCYDLGQTRPIKDIKVYVSDAETDYIRNGKIQVSTDKENWVDVVDIAATQVGADVSPRSAGWASSSTYPNYVYQQGQPAGGSVDARYLRVVFTKENFTAKWLVINEIVINDGEYAPSSNDPTFVVDPPEGSAQFIPSNMVDGDMTTGFRPNMEGRTSGSLIYRLSDQTSIDQINVIQGTSPLSNATVSIRTDDGWTTLQGVTLDKGFNQVSIPEDVTSVYEVKFEWGDVTPTFYEIITVPREAPVEEGQQVASPAEDIPINSYGGEDRTILFDDNWRFYYGDNSGASAVVFDDTSWRLIDLPHDYSIELDYTSAGEAESGYLLGGVGWYRKGFTLDSNWQGKTIAINFGGVYMDSEIWLNGTKLGENHYGYNPFSFVLPNDLLTFTGENVIAIRVNNPVPSSRWYSGSGIYRSVHLTVTNPIHVAQYGTYVNPVNTSGENWTVNVKTDVQNDSAAASSVAVKQELFRLDSSFEKTGSAVQTVTNNLSLGSKATSSLNQTLSVSNPARWNSWDVGDPNLYVMVTTVSAGSTVLDVYETEFGFRTFNFDVNTGFSLNGRNVKLKGVCQHHDQGGLGSEAWYRALERQVDILMNMGVNGIRVTHNPAADELIEICNRKGMLIIDELFDGWALAKNGNTGDFSRWFNQAITSDNQIVGATTGMKWRQFVTERVVNRDKNAPSVIMYSIGNEVQEGSGTDGKYDTYAQEIINWIQAIDTTRLVTRGDNTRTSSTNNEQGRINKAIHDAGGVVGFNYHTVGVIDAGHANGWRMLGSEAASHINSRGVYNIKAASNLNSKKRMTSYDKGHVGWGYTVSEGWWRTIPYDYNAGEFVWTGFDYMGEPTPSNGTGSGWANGSDSPKNSYFGVIDTNGIPKDGYYLYRSMWNESDTTLHLLPTWDRSDLIVSNGNVEVVVYSNAPVVKVFLNGVEKGTATSTTHTTAAGHKYRTFDSGTGCFSQGSNATSLFATFNVPYAEGTLEVKAYQANGTTQITDTVGRSVVRTTDGAASLILTPDRATIKNDDRDLSYVTIDVVDSKGEIINGAEPNITVTVSGPGKLMALDNGVQPDHTSFLVNHRTAGAGRLVAIIQSTDTEGTITVTATTDDGQTGTTTINTTGAEVPSSGNVPVSYTMSKTIFVQRNTRPNLPETVVVNLGNGTSETKDVTWNSYNESLLNHVGSEFSITGTIADYNLTASIGIVVLDDVAALLNYSTAVHVGQTPVLPGTRPAVMSDGTVLNAQFPVTWDALNPADYQQEGTVTVNGAATVFGAEYTVTATIRVTNGTVSVGGNVIDAVSAHPNGFSIDGIDNAANRAILNSLRDGNTTNAAWTGRGTLHFAYDTQQNFYRLRLTYTHSAPSDVTLTLERGAVSIQPTISGNTATYELGAINPSETVDLGFPTNVSLAEVEFIVGTPVFIVNSTALLDNVKLNGESATPAQLAAKLIKTTASTAAIVPVTNSNVAVTILPENADSQVLIVTESEDQGARALYTVQFDMPDEITGPTDDSHDYPYTKTTATAPSQHGANIGATEGPASFAVDGNEDTYYHSRWSSSDNITGTAGNSQGQAPLDSYPDQRYIQLELQEATALSALRYLPRGAASGGNNGTITQYRVETSTDGTNFTAVCSGNFGGTAGWKLATFDQAVTAKYVRLYGVQTYADSGNNKFLSAKEIRLVMSTEDKPDLSAATITIEPSEFAWTGAGIRPGSGNEGATVTVTLNGVELQRPRDYVLSYDNNVDPGTAYLYIRAATGSVYKGSNSATFQIVKNDAKIVSFDVQTVSVQPGIAPVLPSTVVGHTDEGGSMEVPVVWDSVPADWYNFPQEKTRTLQGTVRDTGLLSDPTLRPTLTLSFAYSQSADSVALRTMTGVMPTLPTTSTVHFDNGESGVRAVTKWYLASHGDTPEAAATAPAVTSAAFADAGIVELLGVITGIDRVRARATVRVVGTEGMIPSDENLALNTNSAANVFPFALAYESAGNNNPYQAIKGQTTGSTSATDRWSDWERNTYHTPANTWMGVAFETSTQNVTRDENTVLNLVPHMVNKVKVMFVDENGGTNSAVTFPQDYQIQYYTGPVDDLTFNTNIHGAGDTSASNGGNGRVRYWTGSPLLDDANWADVDLLAAKPAVPSQNGQMLTLEFFPVNTAIIRVQCTSKSNKWTGIQALEVYGLVAPANSDFTVTSVTLGGEEKITEFDENNVLEVTLGLNEDIPQLAVTVNAEDNASVAVTQATRVPGIGEPGVAWAQAVITSEDGSKTTTYTVKFDRKGAPASFSVDLSGVSEASKDKVTVTPTGGAPGTEITVTAARGYQFDVLRAQVTTGDLAGQYRDIRDGKFTLPAGNVSITAEVSPIPYKMTYLLNDGTVERFNPNSYNVETTTFTLYNPTKPGYTFVGWVGAGLTAPTLTVTIAQGSIGDRTYTAVWKANSSIGGGGGNNGGGSSGGSVAPAPVGDVTVITTDRNTGAVTVTTTTTNGLVSAVTTTLDGKQTAVIQVPENSGTDVKAVMPALDSTKAPVVTIQNNTTRPVTVTVPFTGGETVVAVRQNSDGSETVIPMSVVDAEGLRLKAKPGDQIIRLEDNKKNFVDVPSDHWAARAVDFVSSRELFNGMGSTDTFAPTAPMNRAMMTTVLWRLAEKPSAAVTSIFHDVLSGSYYEEAVAWGVANGVVKGTDTGFEPDAPVTRETLAVLLYRAAGSPVVVDELPRRFTDGDQVADWALEAMIWCVQNDIIKGRDAKTLAPKDVANRAEVATMLQRFVNQQV